MAYEVCFLGPGNPEYAGLEFTRVYVQLIAKILHNGGESGSVVHVISSTSMAIQLEASYSCANGMANER